MLKKTSEIGFSFSIRAIHGDASCNGRFSYKGILYCVYRCVGENKRVRPRKQIPLAKRYVDMKCTDISEAKNASWRCHCLLCGQVWYETGGTEDGHNTVSSLSTLELTVTRKPKLSNAPRWLTYTSGHGRCFCKASFVEPRPLWDIGRVALACQMGQKPNQNLEMMWSMCGAGHHSDRFHSVF